MTGWAAWDLAGSRDRASDAVVRDVLGPGLDGPWTFERRTDGAVRVHAAEDVGAVLRRRAGEVAADDGLGALLDEVGVDGSAEDDDGGVDVRAVDDDGAPVEAPHGETAVALGVATSALAASALGDLGDARDRAGLALALLEATAGRVLRDATAWRAAAETWLGGGEDARRLVAALDGAVDEHAAALTATARRLEAERHDDLDSVWAAAVPDAEAAVLHGHLLANRLGLTAPEAALVALVAAGARDEATDAEPAELKDDADEPAQPAGAGVAPEDGDAPAIQARSLVKRYDDETAVDRVDLDVRAGEVVALAGPEGSGKSTLLGLVAGLRLADAGTVRVLGRDPARDRPLLAHDIGLPVPERETARERTVRENLELRATTAGLPTGAAASVLEELGLLDCAGTTVDEVSPGEHRLLTIACALVGDPRVIVLDAPASELEDDPREQLWAALRARAAAGAAVLLTVESAADAEAVADRLVVLDGGAVTASGAPAEVREAAFGAQDEDAENDEDDETEDGQDEGDAAPVGAGSADDDERDEDDER